MRRVAIRRHAEIVQCAVLKPVDVNRVLFARINGRAAEGGVFAEVVVAGGAVVYQVALGALIGAVFPAELDGAVHGDGGKLGGRQGGLVGHIGYAQFFEVWADFAAG